MADDAVVEKMRKVHWVPLESNPDMLGQFARTVGMPAGWGFTDVFGLDDELLAMVPPTCVAVTLLYDSSSENARKFKAEQRAAVEASSQKVSANLRYMRQYVGNACGTIATIHSIANCAEAVGLPCDTALGRFLESTKNMSAEDMGAALADATELHTASESSAQGGQTAAPEATAAVNNHFIAFVEKDGDLYELDGAKAFPINHGPATGGVLQSAAAVIKESFMAKDPDSMHFNVMALVQD